MPKILGVFSIKRRSKKNKAFVLTLNPGCGLPPEVYLKWQRRSFACLPEELAGYRYPKSIEPAKNGAYALIEYLKRELSIGTVHRLAGPMPIGI